MLTHCNRCKEPGGFPICDRCGEDVDLPDHRAEDDVTLDPLLDADERLRTLDNLASEATNDAGGPGLGALLVTLVRESGAADEIVRTLGHEPRAGMPASACRVVGAQVVSQFHAELLGVDVDDRTVEALGLVVGLAFEVIRRAS